MMKLSKRALLSLDSPMSHADAEEFCRKFMYRYPEIKQVEETKVQFAYDLLMSLDTGLRIAQADWQKYLSLRPSEFDNLSSYGLSELRVWMFLRRRYMSLKASRASGKRMREEARAAKLGLEDS